MKSMHVLLVEDTPSLATVYAGFLRKAGIVVETVSLGRDAIKALDRNRFGAVLLDLQLPDVDGFEVLRHANAESVPATFVVITSHGSINRAVEAMRLGAYDFLVKPFAEDRLVTTTRNALERSRLRNVVDEIRDDRAGGGRFYGFIGGSLAMQGVYRAIENVARSKATVFITGESGSGKEVCAEAIHKASPRRDRPFVPLNCGAIPKDLLESEVFGHLKGSFTGAIADRDGAASIADGGTLFLDEICEMELSLQTKLLRFLQTSRIQKVGASRTEAVDVRIVCATNRDPMKEVEAGRFREDLFYRLHVVPIHLPALRERDDDVLQIAQSFLESFSAEEGKAFRRFSQNAIDLLRASSWPGNVRQLQNVMRNAVVLNNGEVIEASMLSGLAVDPDGLRAAAAAAPALAPAMGEIGANGDHGENGLDRASAAIAAADADPNRAANVADDPAHGGNGAAAGGAGPASIVGRKLWEIEKDAIEQTIDACGGSIPRAAKMLGVSPSTIYRKKEIWAASDA